MLNEIYTIIIDLGCVPPYTAFLQIYGCGVGHNLRTDVPPPGTYRIRNPVSRLRVVSLVGLLFQEGHGDHLCN